MSMERARSTSPRARTLAVVLALVGVASVAVSADAAGKEEYKVTRNGALRGYLFGTSGGMVVSCDGYELYYSRSGTPGNGEVRYKPTGGLAQFAKSFGAACDFILRADGTVQRQCVIDPSGGDPKLGTPEKLGRIDYTGTSVTGLYATAYDKGASKLGYVYWSAISSGVYSPRNTKIGTVGSRADNDMVAAAMLAFFSPCPR